MTREIDIERELDLWLGDGHSEVPDRVIAAALDQIKTTRQRRSFGLPRRFTTMRLTYQVLAVTAALLALGMLGALVAGASRPPAPPPITTPIPTAAGTLAPATVPPATLPPASAAVLSPSPSDAPTPSPINAAAWPSFTSQVFGFTMRYPTGWTLVPAKLADLSIPDAVDEFDAPAPSLAGFNVRSERLRPGQTPAQWSAAYVKANSMNPAECFPPSSQWTPERVDGIVGGLHGGAVSCDFTEVVVFDGNRVYLFRAVANRNTIGSDTFDISLLGALLNSVHLTPATAKDPNSEWRRTPAP
jgi:hypothetical protein